MNGWSDVAENRCLETGLAQKNSIFVLKNHFKANDLPHKLAIYKFPP